MGLMHAEVLSWSSPYVLLNPLVFWYVAPVYAVHYIVFGDLILRYGRSHFWVLYAFGCLTGMYEFAITKVYWFPPWQPWSSPVLGVYWVELLLIGFVWHAFMSFTMPYRLLQDYVFPGRTQPGTARDVRFLMVVIPFIQGAMGLISVGNVLLMLGAVLGSLAVITLTLRWFVKAAVEAQVTELEDLVLTPRGSRRGMLMFAAVYIGYGAVLLPQHWGTGVALILPIVFYGLLIGCTYALLRGPNTQRLLAAGPAGTPSAARWNRFVWRYALQFVVAFAGLALLQAVVPAIVFVAGMLFLIGGAVPAFYLMPRLVLEAQKAWRRQGTAPSSPEPVPPAA